MEVVHLEVSGMTCGSCVKHVEKTISAFAGVQKVDVDLAKGAVHMEGQVSEHLDAMLQALKDDGYVAKVTQAS